jgi:hypothetical protein
MKLSFDTVDTLLNAVKDRICHEVYIGVIPNQVIIIWEVTKDI